MLIEQRIYTCAPGKLKGYLAVYEAHGVAVHAEILGHWLGCYVVEVGPLNQVVHLWGFEDFEDRTARRARLANDPRWRNYLNEAAGLVVQQENRLLQPAAFTPALPALIPFLS
jgi:hypothetical protein